MTDRIPLDDLTSDQLDALYDRLDETERLKLLVAASAEDGHAVRRVVALEAENAKLRDWLAHCTHKPRAAELERRLAAEKDTLRETAAHLRRVEDVRDGVIRHRDDLEAVIGRVRAVRPYDKPTHDDRSIGYQMGWDAARAAALAALEPPAAP